MPKTANIRHLANLHLMRIHAHFSLRIPANIRQHPPKQSLLNRV